MKILLRQYYFTRTKQTGRKRRYVVKFYLSNILKTGSLHFIKDFWSVIQWGLEPTTQAAHMPHAAVEDAASCLSWHTWAKACPLGNHCRMLPWRPSILAQYKCINNSQISKKLFFNLCLLFFWDAQI